MQLMLIPKQHHDRLLLLKPVGHGVGTAQAPFQYRENNCD